MKTLGVLVAAAALVVPAFAAKPAPRQAQSKSLSAAYQRPAAAAQATLGGGAYSADFEAPTFAVGDITAQDGWYGTYGNWVVSTANPTTGAQHFRGTSDGFGPGSFALTPDQTAGTLAFSIASANIFLDGAASDTWEFVPQDPTEGSGFINTSVIFNADGTISAVVGPSPGSVVATGDNWPANQDFSIDVIVERATNNFEICLNGASIFTGVGFAPDIENVAFTSDMAIIGDFFDVDDLVILESATGGCAGAEPTIALASFTSTDSCASGAGGGNGVWEPGETIQIPVTLVSNDPFTGVVGTLTSSTPGITIVDGSATWPNLADGVPTQSDAPHFTIRIAEDFACDTEVDLDLSVSAIEGGPFDLSFSELVGAPGVSPATGLPLAIPDNIPAGSSSTITVSASTIITDVNVHVAISHTWVGDLLITLDPPGAAPPIVLLDRPGVPASTNGCSDNNMDVTFDDSGATTPETHCLATTPWLSGVVLPFAALSGLNGTDAVGVWTLTVSDNALQDTGTVTDWDLILTPAPAGECLVCVIVAAEVDLGLSKSVNPTQAAPGDPVVFTLTATNNSVAAATGVVVTDTLPAGLTYVGNNCGAAYAAPTLTWNVGNLAGSASATCEVTVTVDGEGSFLNSAVIDGAETDPVAANNAADAEVVGGDPTSVLEIPVLDRAGLALLALLLAAAAVVVFRRS